MEAEVPVLPGTNATEPAAFAVELARGREAFLKLRPAWDRALLTGPDPAPALEHDFLRLWLESFAAGAEPVTVVVRRSGLVQAALSLLIDDERALGGVPLRVARAAGNSHATRGGLLLGPEGPSAVGALVDALVGLDWDELVLRDLPREGGSVDLLEVAFARHGLTVVWGSTMQSPFVPLPMERAELERRLDAKFRQNLRRRRRRLESHGTVLLETLRGLEGLDEALEEAFEIESSGWKGQAETSIRSRPETVHFYARWARQLAREGRLRLSFLRSGDERVAFHFAHVTRGRYHLPKCGYRESWATESPGQLLAWEVLGACIDEHLETFEFLGHAMDWKRDWTPFVRPHVTVHVHRPTWRGRWSRLAGHTLRPWAASTLRALGARRRQT
jgi:CelD/BcsL family acetyltransferase involved in cellulose biosynthesis